MMHRPILRLLCVLSCILCYHQVHAEDAEIKLQARELAPLLAHGGAILGPPDRPTHLRDDDKFRETAARLARQGATPELQDLAKQCVTIAAKLDKSHVLYDELTKDRPGPGKNIFQMMQWVAEQSQKGAFRWNTTTVRQEHGWTITETGVKDHTLEAALFYGTIGMAMNQEAERKHQIAVFKLRQSIAKELIKVGDEVEQLRLKSNQRLLATGFAPFAGAPNAAVRLEFKMGRADPKGSPLEEEWKQRAAREGEPQRALTREEERQREEIRSQQVHPFLRIVNPGPPLHHVVLSIDYVHYRFPQEPVMRQFYWIPEWKTGDVFAVTDAFRLNLPNRATAGLAEDVNELRGSCGQRMFPGFMGLLGVKYSLVSDELRHDSVEVEFTQNREELRDSMLQSAEDLAQRLTGAASNSGEWSGLKANDKAERLKVMTAASRECAQIALSIAAPDWPQSEHAKALTKDFKSISKQTESQRTTALKACEDGNVFVGVRDGDWAQSLHMRGRYAIEFQSAKPSSQRIDVVITKAADGVNPIDPKPFVGRLIVNPSGRAETVLSLVPPPKTPTTGKKPTTPTVASKVPDKAPAGGNRAVPVLEDIRSSKVPGTAWFDREWRLRWVKDHWECAFDNTRFEFAESKPAPLPIAGSGAPKDGPKPKPTPTQAALQKGATGFEDKSVWEGTRRVAGANGKVVKEEKVQLVIQYRSAEIPGTGGGTYEAELIINGDQKSRIQVRVNVPAPGTISWLTHAAPRPGERFPRGTDPYRGTLKNNVIEVLSERTSDNPNAEHAMIQLRPNKTGK